MITHNREVFDIGPVLAQGTWLGTSGHFGAGGRITVVPRNDRLRQAREATPSPRTPGAGMTRVELAEAVNQWLITNTGRAGALDAHALARYERGAVRSPNKDYRVGLRTILGASDSGLGFSRDSDSTQPHTTTCDPATGTDNIDSVSPADSETVAEFRGTISHLVGLDGTLGGGQVAPLAIKAFRRCQRLLDQGSYRPSAERDLEAVAAELGEVTGWTLIDAGRFTEAHQINTEALRLAVIAGDAPMQWFVLSNDALISLYRGDPHGALRIARRFAERDLPNRVRALFEIRQARALAVLGDGSGAQRTFDRVRGALTESVSRRDPSWTWWVDQRELVTQHGRIHESLGRPAPAVELFTQAVALGSGKAHLGWANVINRANLLRASLSAQAWPEAEQAAVELLPMIDEVSSGRTEMDLRTTLSHQPHGIPSSLADVLEALRGKLG